MTFSIVIGLVQIIFGKTVAAFKMKAQKGQIRYRPFCLGFCHYGIGTGIRAADAEFGNCPKPSRRFFGIAVIGLVVAYLYNSPGKNIF